jgi:hypothetical protein
MDDEKSITERLTDAIGKATDSVKNTMSHIVETASVAAQHAMESNAQRMSRPAATARDSGPIAATAGEPVYLPEATDAAAMPVPLMFAQPVPNRKRKPRAGLKSGKAPAAKKAAAPKPGKNAAKKPAKKRAPKKSKTKKSKTNVKKKTVKNSARKKTAKKVSKKPAKRTKKRSKR